VNGTYLNGQKLVPYQQRVLRNQDDLRLGRLVLRISYMSAPKTD
jgi:pSer/pThr/pTyr-binding forkhead associated (FHA) protein